MDNGALKVRMRANTSLFEPALSQIKAPRWAVRSLIDRAFNGTFRPLIRFLLPEEKLSAETRAELKRSLEEQEGKGGKQ